MLRSLVGSEMCIRDSINAEYGGDQKRSMSIFDFCGCGGRVEGPPPALPAPAEDASEEEKETWVADQDKLWKYRETAGEAEEAALEVDVLEAVERGDVHSLSAVAQHLGSERLNTLDENGRTGLHRAVLKGDLQVTKLFLSYPLDLEAVTPFEYTALHIAASQGHAEIVAELLLARANVNATGGAGMRPLHLAAESGNAVAVQALLEAKAKPAALTRGVVPSTALDMAKLCRHEQVVNLLQEALSGGKKKPKRQKRPSLPSSPPRPVSYTHLTLPTKRIV
eukprot:TRINITY_DN26937_c0_g1_i2.p1 TRINITY_DN26937_c0_g1~~TRINITY_DN26937_c0_g1_i2.p1  ORF type:complete len:280 (-),score=75.28 TRINITY_DN26937_c0_g1_i2:151-990(-)